MILFPNAKINLGLRVIERRPDGYHNLQTVMVPTAWTDILEIVPARGAQTTLTTYGRVVDCPAEKNLVMKAYRAVAQQCPTLPAADIFLEKIIPDGAGLGGGSSDAAFTILGLNEVFELGMDRFTMARIAATVGADCSFFIYNQPAYCTGIGTDISLDVSVQMEGLSMATAKPRGQSVSTAQAYAGITPRAAEVSPREIVAREVELWKGLLVNDFEPGVIAHIPRVGELIAHFYAMGAQYAAMSGS
ncbi:MAG: 4-(cytidine 5'-diphospho)-2-C-methyl-D-erythritol kinase, partial [Muribaculaceae bacterium]